MSQFPVTLSAQDVVAEMPSLPTGFSSTVVKTANEDGDQGGLDLSLGLNLLYDSNVTQGSSGGLIEAESDWRLTPSVTASYLLGNQTFQLGARANLEHNFFQNRDDFSATNYSLGAFGGYRSKKIVASFTSGFSSNAGINRFTGGFIEQFTYNTGLLASYRFSAKTSLLATWDQQSTEAQTDGFGDISSVTTGLSAVWQATPLLSIGPGFRYGIRTGIDDEEFTVFGPTMRLDYQLSTKIKLRSSIGIDDADSPFTGGDTLLNWSAALNYRASALWGFDLEMIRDTQASLAQGGGFDQITSYRLGYWRKIRKARAQLGISYQDREPTDSQPTIVGVRESTFWNVSASLTFPVFKDKADLALNVLWSDQSSPDDNFNWDGLQTGLGLQWSF